VRGISFYQKDFFTFKIGKELYAEEIQRLLMTNPGERLGQPYFGVGLKYLLFELADTSAAAQAEQKIKDQVKIYLPMIEITSLETVLENNSFYINIGFIEKGELLTDERILTLEFAGVEEQ